MRHHRARRIATALALATTVTATTLALAGTGASAATSTTVSAAGASARAPLAARSPEDRIGFTRQVTMNVAFGMRPRRHRHDVRRATREADVIGWQEINRESQTRAIDQLGGWGTYWAGGRRPDGGVWRYPTNTSPISWRRSMWSFVRGETRLASREIRNVVRARYLTFVVLQHKASGERIIRWNIHFVPNAMNSARVRKKGARRAAWHRQARTVKAFLDQYRGRGHAAIIGGGDINWRTKFAGNRVSYDTHHKRIDYLTHVWSPRVKAAEPRFYAMNSDHDKVRVGYTLYR